MRTVLALLAAGGALLIATTPVTPAASSVRVLDVGDSLSIGTAPHLRARLAGYRIARAQAVGLRSSEIAGLVSARRSSLPSVLVVSAGTNDDPRDVSIFARSVATIVGLAGPRRCVVWSTIVRPPAFGTTYDGLNRVLRRVAARHQSIVLVDWVGMVRRHPGWLSRDGVHASDAGYGARGAAIAQAVRTRCAR